MITRVSLGRNMLKIRDEIWASTTTKKQKCNEHMILNC